MKHKPVIVVQPSNFNNSVVPDTYKTCYQISPNMLTTEHASPSRAFLECKSQIISNSTSTCFHDRPSTIANSESNIIEIKRPKVKCSKDKVININDPTKNAIAFKQLKNLHHNVTSDYDNLIPMLPKLEIQSIKEERLSADEYDSDIQIVEHDNQNNIKLEETTVVSYYLHNNNRKKNSLLSRLVFEDD